MAKGQKTFDSVTAVRAWLEDEGFIATRSTVNRHHSQGLFSRTKAGVFEEKAVMTYALANLKRAESGKSVTSEERERAERKAEIEFKLRQEQYLRERIKRIREEGGVIDVDQYHQDLAARMAFFSLQLDGFAVKQAEAVVDVMLGKRLERAAQLIEVVGGDPDKVRELAAWLERLVPELSEVYLAKKRQWLESFARDRVQVVDLGAAPLAEEAQESEEADDVPA
ncbi:hypothetical protein [Pseudodesulfovibrio pelocollis]|uniref:hypothetical protein n=1 Tax=Pseudodesulfovibrio pelocollis TaxID=3051432 RepID=UPI00255B3407|nr:hypothetical protein [Pseudodesulfovibrio sp. SB368]